MWRIVAALILVAGCKKEAIVADLSYTATGRNCSVVFWDGDTEHRDTLTFNVDYSGGGDTLSMNGKWNIVAEEGDRLFIEVCPLSCDSALAPPVVRINGVESTAAPCQCARIDEVFHQ